MIMATSSTQQGLLFINGFFVVFKDMLFQIIIVSINYNDNSQMSNRSETEQPRFASGKIYKLVMMMMMAFPVENYINL